MTLEQWILNVKLASAHIRYLCISYDSANNAWLFLSASLTGLFLMEIQCVYIEVGTELLSII
jgi:hypothetical protein